MPLPAVIHRAELPIDDHPHGIDLTGDLLGAAVRRPGAVDVWYWARRDQTVPHMRRSFQIVATGQPVPPHLGTHHATAVTGDGMLVWHVLENHCPHPDVIEVRMMEDPAHRVPGICDFCHVDLIGDGQGEWTPR
ncbi:hypothetical protein [Streptomyces sp. NPDC046862]|uniref:DUF7352 domain-containing protein n=1 Tax=Streptomyces sp. NPDC046862 TaxID=3154603 RepID=UPI003457002A